MKTRRLMLGDCLQRMAEIEDGSVDMVMADPPYGTTACKWDSVIDLDRMWEHLKRLIKPNGAIVLMASQPFTTTLISSNFKMFKYCWVWDKVNKYTGALQANKRPMRRHEDIVVMYINCPVYNKQWRKGKAYQVTRTKGHGEFHNNQDYAKVRKGQNDGEHHNPCTILQIKGDNKKEAGLHPTQKPVALMEYLICTYTNKGDTVLDFAMGSGTTGVACKHLHRRFIGIELDKGYYRIARKRIRDENKKDQS